MYKKIMFSDLTFPEDMAADTQDFIGKLLVRDPTQRLGHGPSGSTDVKAHPYFANINWDKLYNKEVEAPWKPEVRRVA